MKRSGKFYFRNEKSLLKSLGLVPCPGSGSGWVHKEDGENELALVQLKSTDASSYTVKQLDIKTLEYNASVSHKVPVFLIQFLQDNKVYALISLDNLSIVNEALFTGKVKERVIVNGSDDCLEKKELVITSKKGREEFFKERSERNGKRKHY